MLIRENIKKQAQDTRGMSHASRKNIRVIVPVIPLERKLRTTSEKKLSGPTFKLRAQPNNENSQTYELTVPVFRSGTPEEWLLCKRDIKRIIRGQNVTTGPEMYAMARRILDGEALTAFELAATTRGNENVENFSNCLNDVTNHFFPRRALVLQKRWMRYYLRKEEEMSIREYVGRVDELNKYLEQFPPFQANQTLPTVELLEALEFSVPPRWQKKMMEMDFEPTEHSVDEFIKFCERWERLEMTEKVLQKDKVEKGNFDHDERKKKFNRSSPTKKEGKGNGKWCEVHESTTHNTVDCFVVKNAKKRDNRSDENPKSKRFKKSNEDSERRGNRSFDKREIHAITEQVIKAVSRRFGGKRGDQFRSDAHGDSDSESSGHRDEDHGMFQELHVAQSKLDKLNLDDDVSDTSEKARAEILGLDE